MDYLHKLRNQLTIRLFIAALATNALIIGGWWLMTQVINLEPHMILIIASALGLAAAWLFARYASSLALQPTRALWQTVVNLAPGDRSVEPANIEKLRVGRELVTALNAQIYQLASQNGTSTSASTATGTSLADSLLKQMSVPMIGLDNKQDIVYANQAAADYLRKPLKDLQKANFYSVFNLSFSGEQTFDRWLNEVSTSKADASDNWERVRADLGDDTTKQFDLAAHYSKDNPSGVETTLALFDHSTQYGEDDSNISFIALAVHELRTPLTLLRGYIEVFERELPPDLQPELAVFVKKMNAAAKQLTSFVSNILNVARVESDQLTLSLQENNWAEVLNGAVSNLSLLAEVRGISIDCQVAGDLPSVGVDRLSINEVINNLVDNAVKYSPSGSVITIRSVLNNEGLVETTVEDTGVGIPASTLPNLFTKFYRNFRNRAKVGGTGLGLYLCKAVIGAHGGNIWVRSQENVGTTIGFTLIPYAQLADSQKNGDNAEIIRGAHGWIKNHSLYRR
jgi:signal transduction histidine kinase